jgi:LuxR family maltose regulon positive regulatory protein
LALNEMGQRRQAEELCRQATQESVDQRSTDLILAEGINVVWSLLSYEADQLDLAQEQAKRALELSRQANIADGIMWALFNLAHAYSASGQIDLLLETTREAQQFAARLKPGAIQAVWCGALEAQVSLQKGDLDAVARWGAAAGLKPEDSPHYWHEFVYFVYIRYLLAQSWYQDAQTLLTSMEHSAESGGRYRKLITIYLLQARVKNALGGAPQSLEFIKKAVNLAAPQDYRRAFIDEGETINNLLSQARDIAPQFVDEILITAEALGKAAPLKSQDSLVEPLSDRELEILRLIAAGRSNPEIAEILYLSLNTVKWHAKNLYGKLAVNNRVEAVTRAQELDLL